MGPVMAQIQAGDDSQCADQGQVTPLLAAGVALVAVMLLALAPMGRALSDRAQARTAADAAALAGAAAGEVAAKALAEANRGELLRYEEIGDDVVVKVEVGGVGAFSRARGVKPAPLGASVMEVPGGGDRAGLARRMMAALARADGLLGEPVPVVSGLRSREQQEALWQRRHANPYPVARPGTSMHERGLAVDVPRGFVDRLLAVAAEVGLCQPLPRTDPVHFEVCGARG